MMRLRMATSATICILFFAAVAPKPIQAFGGRLQQPHQPRSLRRGSQRATAVTTHNAIIYGGIDDDFAEEEYKTYDSLGAMLGTTEGQAQLTESITNAIGAESLLRIACAFAPPPHNHLHPQDVIDAPQLVNVDSTSVGIAVAVADGYGGCAQVLVPVPFPNPCHGDLDEDCVLENLRLLDSQATERIVQNEWTDQNGEELDRQRDIVQALQEEPMGYDLPDWWTYATLNFFLEEECTLLKDLLNGDDFAGAVSDLFRQRYDGGGNDEDRLRILKGCVASVGPAGLFLRAQVKETGSDREEEEEADEGVGGGYTTKELAIQFDNEAKSVDVLWSSVLRLMESVEHEDGSAQEEEKAEVEASFSLEIVEEEEAPRQQEVVGKDLTPQLEEVARKEEAFHRNLLEARLQIDLVTNRKLKATKKGAFQRRLLGARLKYDQQKSIRELLSDAAEERLVARNMNMEAFQRNLPEARLQSARVVNQKLKAKNKEAFQRLLLSARLKYDQEGIVDALSDAEERLVERKKDYFQRNLLEARLQNDRVTNRKQKVNNKEAFQRRLLNARLKLYALSDAEQPGYKIDRE